MQAERDAYWLLDKKDGDEKAFCSYMCGMLGQYIIAIPALDAIVVRLGRKRSDVYTREITTDITRYMDIAMKILGKNEGI